MAQAPICNDIKAEVEKTEAQYYSVVRIRRILEGHPEGSPQAQAVLALRKAEQGLSGTIVYLSKAIGLLTVPDPVDPDEEQD